MNITKKIRSNARHARAIWGDLPKPIVHGLTSLTAEYDLSVSAGDLQLLEGRWYVTHAGLLRISTHRRCSGIRTVLEKGLSNPATARWVFRATVYKTPSSKGFVGYGDADPSNVSPLVRGAEMRIAETRAVNRALRKAYGIGLCSVEELGWISEAGEVGPPSAQFKYLSRSKRVEWWSESRLRDQLCLLIRQYNLDPNLVKAYAADFCGTETLKDASRDLVESFISHISSSAKEDIDGLICKLNSYSRPPEVKQ